jgi:squalene-hopene/tetraprenyl-beta-curcumene cyclase
MFTRRQFLNGCTALAVGGIGLGRQRSARCAEAAQLIGRIDEGLMRAARYLADQQAADGAWRSKSYGPLKDGPSLAALIASSLAGMSESAEARGAFEKAVRFLAQMVGAHGTMEAGVEVTYPVYTAAGAVIAMSHEADSGRERARDAWLAELRRRQLTEDLGWKESDLAYGGWGYSQQPPRRPENGAPPSPLDIPNLSATAFALDALCIAGCPADDPAIRKARVFMERCQNWSSDSALHDPQFDDGGFYFILEDPIRNKAGVVGTDTRGQTRFASYGSATADGLRGLLACGLTAEQPRVKAAVDWLGQNFSATEHPGGYAAERRHARMAVYYYYSASVAQALHRIEMAGYGGEPHWAPWATTISLALLAKQRMDGAWSNPVVDVREDDPLVATPLAMRALVECRAALAERITPSFSSASREE